MRTLAIALVAAGCSDVGSTSSPRDTAAPVVWDPDLARMEDEALILVNEERARGGDCDGTSYPPARPLVLDPVLHEVARAFSQAMAEEGFFAHEDPQGRGPAERYADAGFTGDPPWGENLAGGHSTAASVVAGWVASPHHCGTLRDDAFGATGIGLFRLDDDPQRLGWFWTQDFAGTPGDGVE